jgi:hypothetical protein
MSRTRPVLRVLESGRCPSCEASTAGLTRTSRRSAADGDNLSGELCSKCHLNWGYVANMANGAGRNTAERELFDALVDLVRAGEEGIPSRRLTNSALRAGLIVLRTDPNTYLVQKTNLAHFEQLESRGLARRLIDRRHGPEGSEETERFVRTEQAVLSLAGGDPFTLAELEEATVA